MQVIIYLDTGAGKTLVAALLAKHQIAYHNRPTGAAAGASCVSSLKKRVVCLVPTTILVAQQAAVFRQYVAQSVGEYTGSMGVDAWSRERWLEEIECAYPLPPYPTAWNCKVLYAIIPHECEKAMRRNITHRCICVQKACDAGDDARHPQNAHRVRNGALFRHQPPHLR